MKDEKHKPKSLEPIKEENNSLWAWTSEEDGSLTLKWIGGNN